MNKPVEYWTCRWLNVQNWKTGILTVDKRTYSFKTIEEFVEWSNRCGQGIWLYWAINEEPVADTTVDTPNIELPERKVVPLQKEE